MKLRQCNIYIIYILKNTAYLEHLPSDAASNVAVQHHGRLGEPQPLDRRVRLRRLGAVDLRHRPHAVVCASVLLERKATLLHTFETQKEAHEPWSVQEP